MHSFRHNFAKKNIEKCSPRSKRFRGVLESKSPKNGIFEVLAARKMGLEQKMLRQMWKVSLILQNFFCFMLSAVYVHEIRFVRPFSGVAASFW